MPISNLDIPPVELTNNVLPLLVTAIAPRVPIIPVPSEDRLYKSSSSKKYKVYRGGYRIGSYCIKISSRQGNDWKQALSILSFERHRAYIEDTSPGSQ